LEFRKFGKYCRVEVLSIEITRILKFGVHFWHPFLKTTKQSIKFQFYMVILCSFSFKIHLKTLKINALIDKVICDYNFFPSEAFLFVIESRVVLNFTMKWCKNNCHSKLKLIIMVVVISRRSSQFLLVSIISFNLENVWVHLEFCRRFSALKHKEKIRII
jgi:hypothetical protein